MLLLSLAFYTTLLIACDHDPSAHPGAIPLTGEWKILTSDSPDHARPDFNDADAAALSIPGEWMNLLKKNDDLVATVWLRKKVFIGREYKAKQMILSFGRIGVADEVYLNGEKIGFNGIIPGSPRDLAYHMSWQNPRRYVVPGRLVHYGGENTVALRIYSHVLNGIMGHAAISDYSEPYFGQLFAAYKPLIINIVSLALNTILLFVFFILFLSAERKAEHLFFFLVILFTAVCGFLMLETPLRIDGLWRYKLFLIFYVLTNFFVLHGIMTFLDIRSRFAVNLSCALLCLVGVFILSAPTTKFLIYYCGLASLVFINLCIIIPAAMFMVYIRKDPRRYWYFLFLAVPIPLSVLRNSWYLFSFKFNELPMVIFLHVPLVFTAITMYYIYDFGRSQKEKDILYSSLLKKTRNFQRIISTIKTENKKPEPREIINGVIEYLDVHYNERYDRIELSKKFGLNEDYMGQLFKKVTGTNISNYINANKINAAKDLLTGTNAKIIDIAYHVGFDNLTHFHRQFKKLTGCTPNEYRAIVKKSSDQDEIGA